MNITITSHEDDTVTLTVGEITARIEAPSWHEANHVAHLLGELLVAKKDTAALARKLRHMTETAREAEALLENASRIILEMSR